MSAHAGAVVTEAEQPSVPSMAGALVIVIVIMAVLGAATFWLDARAQSVADRQGRLAANIERIRYFDEVLTMSARLAASSGDSSYRGRYDSFAPQLEALIQETIALAANPYAEAKMRAIDTAHARLSELELDAFRLAEAGRGTYALVLLSGTEYRAEKERYSLGLEGAITEIDGAVRAEHDQQQAIRLLIPLIVLSGGIVIAGVWLRYRRVAADLLGRANLTAHRGAVHARLSDRLTFALEEEDLLEAAVGALSLLVPTSSGDVLVLNPSQDRLFVGASWGEDKRSRGSLVAIDRPIRCPALRRGAAYLSEDLGDPLAVVCPAHPVAQGAILCIPLLALGQVIGVLHLARETGRFDIEDQGQAGRLAEQVALALANARLLRTMEGLAMADPLTGLYNMRFFEPLLERELAISAREEIPIGLIMLDVDHFKRFNDNYGHPGGDAALRAFGALLKSSLRESDTVARYGGEEFVILVRGADVATTRGIAEKLRLAAENLVIELGPGRFGRLTASFGVAGTEALGYDGKSLIETADQALYQAKELGRNRVVVAEPTDHPRRISRSKPKPAPPGNRTIESAGHPSGRPSAAASG